MSVKAVKSIQQELDQRLERVPARFLEGYHNTLALAKSTVNQVHFVATRIIVPAGELLIIATGGDALEPLDEHEIYSRRKWEYRWTRFTTDDEIDALDLNIGEPSYLLRDYFFNDEEIHRRLQTLDELRNSLPLTPQLRGIVLAYIGYHGVFPTEQEENTAEWGKQIRIAVFSSFKSCVENGEGGVNERETGAMRAANIVGEYLDEEEVRAQPEIPAQPESLWNTIFSCWSHKLGRLLT